MARSRRRLAAALACAALMWASPANALRALHVDALGMHADRTQLHVGQVFHLAIHVHVRETVSALDELVIPDVGTMQLEGDERHVSASPAGTDVVETLTLEPTQPGSFTFAPAYLDAVDARTGKPSRFSSNPVHVVVVGPGPLTGVSGALEAARSAIITALLVFGALGLLVTVAIVAARRSRRRLPAPVPIEPAMATPPPAAARTPRDAVRDALRVYRVAPSTAALMTLRGRLFEAAGVSAGATLRDARVATADPGLRAALDAAEQTAFGPAYTRDAAANALIDATEAWLR
ncbi:MAG TPA: hypothetical protein VHT53_04605 [Candidatus Elarobacter sp.]|nr:hypothetical protein [Candidatus Elarobacter sp.]